MKTRCTLALVLIFAFALAAFAQSGNQGTLEGTVADPSGALVPGAKLTVTNEANGTSFVTQSSQDGLYRFPVLPVGVYDLKTEKDGFAPKLSKGIRLDVGAKLNLDVKLAVSGSEQSITVSEEAPLIETTRTQVSSTVDQNSVANLPVNGRNFID